MGWGTFVAGQVISQIRRGSPRRSRRELEADAESLRILARGIAKTFAALESWNEKWWNARSQKWQWMNPYRIKWLNFHRDIDNRTAERDTPLRPVEKSTAPAPNPNVQTLERKIEELTVLREKGLISQQEFVEAKRKALGL